MTERYDVLHTTQLLANFVVDQDLKLVIQKWIDILKKHPPAGPSSRESHHNKQCRLDNSQKTEL